MKKIESIDVLHNIILDLAKAFHQVCIDNGIPYYMLGGTLLGAIRHKGFIPWDDDIDFGVPRAFYDKLIQILKDNLPSQYSVYSKEDGIVASGFIKIADDRTLHTHTWDENPDKPFGINIDIFPIDYVAHKWKRRAIDFLMRVQGYKIYKVSDRPFHKRIIAYLIKVMLFGVGNHGILSFVERHLFEKDGKYMSNNFGVYGIKEIVPKEYFGTPKLYNFEDVQLYGVAMPHEYLTAIYGDYMQLPPEKKRRVHIIDMYWK